MSLIMFIVFLVSILLVAAYCRLQKLLWTKKNNAVTKEAEAENTEASSKESSAQTAPNYNPVLLAVYRLADDYTYLLSRIVGYIPSHIIRMGFYKWVFCMSVGKGTTIHYGLEVRNPWAVTIGKGCIIGDRAILDARYGIIFDDYVNVSTECYIWTLQHDVNSPSFGAEGEGKSVHVGKRAWLSSRTTLLPGCDVPEGCVLAAGATLTKCINEPFEIWGGVPAKKISERAQNLEYEFDGKGHRWFL